MKRMIIPDKYKPILVDERGFVLVGALLILLLLVLIGISATTSTTLELQIAGSHKVRALSFYAAEAGQSFARASSELTGSANVASGVARDFPTPEQLNVNANVDRLGANAEQSFAGTSTYQGPGPLPPGSGYSEDYVAHYYLVASTGRGPNSAETTVAVRAYRVGP